MRIRHFYRPEEHNPLNRPEHFPGCEQVHFECALKKLEEMEKLQELVSEASNVIGLARTQYESIETRTLEQDELLVAMCDWEDSLDTLGEDEDVR